MPLPQIEVLPAAAKRVRHHDAWVFRDELATPQAEAGHGEVVELTDRHGAFLAYAFYSQRSHIAARIMSLQREVRVDRALFAARVQSAIGRRASLQGTNARRLVFSEADALPGLIVDQYDQWLVLQSRSAGMESWKGTVVDLLREAVRPRGILERSDKEFRDEEGLPVSLKCWMAACRSASVSRKTDCSSGWIRTTGRRPASTWTSATRGAASGG